MELLLTFVLFVTVAGGIYIFKQSKIDLFRPVVFGGVLFIWFYIFDIIYSLYDSMGNPSFFLSGSSFLYETDGLVLVALVISLSFIGWLLGDAFVGKIIINEKHFSKGFKTNEIRYSFRLTNTIGIASCLVLLGILAIFLNFISSVGGLSWYLENIAARALIFEEASYLYSLIQMGMAFGAIVCGFLFAAFKSEKKQVTLVIVIVLLFSLIISLGLLTGARANILKALIIMTLIGNYFTKKLKLNLKLILSLVLLCICFVTYASQTRTNFDIGEKGMIDHIFNSVEVSQANNLLIIEQLQLDGRAQGETIISGLLSFIPSSVFEMFGSQKEYGGNAYFTEAVWPDRWFRTSSEIALGFVGDFILNFGFWVTPVLIFLTSCFYRFLYECLIKSRILGIWGIIIYFGVIWSLFQIVRGDLFNTINNFVVFVASCTISFVFIRVMFIISEEEVSSERKN